MDYGPQTTDYLPISMLNQLEYCERRFWLMYVHSEMGVNAPVLEGIQQHERAHSRLPLVRPAAGGRLCRRGGGTGR
jgi:CRISPR/Cas system-associated exonuclease Cas4 (RecB family)